MTGNLLDTIRLSVLISQAHFESWMSLAQRRLTNSSETIKISLPVLPSVATLCAFLLYKPNLKCMAYMGQQIIPSCLHSGRIGVGGGGWGSKGLTCYSTSIGHMPIIMCLLQRVLYMHQSLLHPWAFRLPLKKNLKSPLHLHHEGNSITYFRYFW